MLDMSSPIRSVTVEIAPGELIDKITILEIKSEWVTDPQKLPQRARRVGGLDPYPRSVCAVVGRTRPARCRVESGQ